MRKQYIYIYTHRHCWWVCMEVSDWRRKTSVDVAIVSRKWCQDTVPGSRSNTPRSFSRRNWPGRIHRSLDNCSRLLARFASPTPTVSTVTFLILFQIYIYWFIKNHVLRGAIISPKKEDETNVLWIETLNRRFELDPTGWNAITCRYISDRDNTGQTGVKRKTNPSVESYSMWRRIENIACIVRHGVIFEGYDFFFLAKNRGIFFPLLVVNFLAFDQFKRTEFFPI